MSPCRERVSGLCWGLTSLPVSLESLVLCHGFALISDKCNLIVYLSSPEWLRVIVGRFAVDAEMYGCGWPCLRTVRLGVLWRSFCVFLSGV